MRVEESIIIDRPAEEVFEFLSVRTNDPVWMASVTESEWLDPAEPMRVGRRGRMVMRAMGRLTAPLTARIVRRTFRADLARLKDILKAEAEVTR